tara:strand:- start:1130 stop:1732 length:603 start_codon:yes stop_codon:yes gene_type:complete
MSNIVYPQGSTEVPVSASVVIFTEGSAKIYYYYNNSNIAPIFVYSSSVTEGEVLLTPGATVSKIRIDAGAEKVYYNTDALPFNVRKMTSITSFPAYVRNTIADSGTVEVTEHITKGLYQDASGGSVKMKTASAASLAFDALPVGSVIVQYHSSNHATNTSTISGGKGVKLIGSGAVTSTGGQYLLVKKTTIPTYDFVRVG